MSKHNKHTFEQGHTKQDDNGKQAGHSEQVDLCAEHEQCEQEKSIESLKLEAQLKEENNIALTNMLKTLQADFENFRKRNMNLKQEAYSDGVASVIKRMLPCYDAIEGALRSVDDVKVKDGLEILKREFLNAFKDFKITPIEAVGQMFDANLHNAIASEHLLELL